MPFDYEELYESHASETASDVEVVGGGDFDRIGRVELEILRDASLRSTATLVDLGCGTGRLAVHAIPYLEDGRYIGIEVAPSILERARRRVDALFPAAAAQWIHTTDTTFPLPDESVDIVCAFSVFTHIEHEDAYRYLVDARRISRPGGRFIFSCIPLEDEFGRGVFRSSAKLPLEQRWGSNPIRSVVTSRDLMDAISVLAGWRVVGWRGGDHRYMGGVLGQAVCVLELPTQRRVRISGLKRRLLRL